jgi:hypothetical protein
LDDTSQLSKTYVNEGGTQEKYEDENEFPHDERIIPSEIALWVARL